MHVPRRNRMQYRVSLGSLENVSRIDSEHWQCHPDISVRNTCSPWEVCESSSWQPGKHQWKARAVLKRQETSPAFLQTERHLLIMPRGKCFKVGLSGHKSLLKEPVLPCPSQEDDSLQVLSGYLTGQFFKKWTIHVMKSSTADVKWCVEDVVSVLKVVWHAQVCSAVGGNCN